MAVVLSKLQNYKEPENIEKTLERYKDVDGDSRYAKEIAMMTEAGIFSGDADGNFKPNATMTRQQMATVTAEAFNLKSNDQAVDLSDLDKVHASHRDNVKALVQNGVVIGKKDASGDRYFDPKAPLTRVQFAILLDKSMNLPDIPNDTISNVSDDKVTIGNREYNIADDVKGIFNAANNDVLNEAVVKFKTADGMITEVTNLEIASSGTDNEQLVLDGKGNQIAGNASVNGDNVSLNNLTITGDLTVTGEEFEGNDLKVEGETILGDAPSEKATVAVGPAKTATFNDSTLGKVSINKVGGHIDFTGNSTVNEIVVTKNSTITGSEDVKIPKLRLQDDATDVEVNGEEEEVNITAKDKDTTLSGNAKINNLTVNDAKSVKVETTGDIGKLESKKDGAKLTVRKGTNIGNVVVPEGSKVEDVIDNYEEIKDQVDEVNGEPSPAPPVTPPPSDGGNGDDSGDDQTPDNSFITATSSAEVNADDVTIEYSDNEEVIATVASQSGDNSDYEVEITFENAVENDEEKAFDIGKIGEEFEFTIDNETYTAVKDGDAWTIYTEDEVRANKVSDLIAELPEAEAVGTQHGDQIDEAREAYDTLSEAQQDLVSNLDKLTTVEDAYNEIAIEATLTTINSLSEANESTHAQKVLQQLADLTANKNGDDKFVMDNVKEENLNDYLVAFSDNEITSVKDVSEVINDVNAEVEQGAELEDAKENAKAELDEYVDSGDYTVNADSLNEAITNGKTGIDGAEDTDTVESELTKAKQAIDDIDTDEQDLVSQLDELNLSLSVKNEGKQNEYQNGSIPFSSVTDNELVNEKASDILKSLNVEVFDEDGESLATSDLRLDRYSGTVKNATPAAIHYLNFERIAGDEYPVSWDRSAYKDGVELDASVEEIEEVPKPASAKVTIETKSGEEVTLTTAE